MSDKVLKSIDEMVNEAPAVDREQTFNRLWAITCALFEKVQQRFELHMDPVCQDLQPYSGRDGASGRIAAYSGPEIDWLIHSWTGNPKATFTNMHLTVGLGPQSPVPHLGFALGTTPDLFAYMDYLPRLDLVANPDYVDRYYAGEPNQTYLDMMQDPDFRPFISRDMYTRVSLTPNALCFSADDSSTNLDKLERVAHAHVDRWLGWVDAAEAVPSAQRAAQAERDLLVRRTITERDPANCVGEALFGKTLTDRLVATLWGGNRSLPRPE